MTEQDKILKSGGSDILPSQYFANLNGPPVSEQRLAAAILEYAVEEYQMNAPHVHLRNRGLFREAETWIMSKNLSWPFSFENCCFALNLDPDYLRKGLRSWRLRREKEIQQGQMEEQS